MSDENWLPVTGFEGLYEVSDHGHVRSLDRLVHCVRTTTGHRYTRRIAGQVRTPKTSEAGYAELQLWRDGKATDVLVHVLVLTAFVGAAPDGTEGCHNDGDPGNNHVSNLRWDTRSENQNDCVRHGTHAQTRKTHCPQQHPYSDENTYWLGNHRMCRTCRRIRNREAAERRKSA